MRDGHSLFGQEAVMGCAKEVLMVASINGSTTGIVPIPVAMVDAQTHIAGATGSDYESESG